MSSSKKPKANVPRYNMSIHYGICHAPVDAVTAVFIGEKRAWRGHLTNNASVGISNEKLFGGMKQEGGVGGTCDFMFGGPDQLASSSLAARLGAAPANLPGFRGILSMFFHRGRKGYYWAAGNPYLKPMWVRVRSIPRGLGGPHAEVPRGTPQGDGIPDPNADMTTLDANPAHIIYECYTNNDWGLGEIPANLDRDAFLAVARVLYYEYCGLSLTWSTSGTAEDFVNTILQHINGSMFTHPVTGKITIRLIREDYDVDTLRVVNMDNARLATFSRKAWGETTNEMKVTWTRPENENEETVYAQDLGNMAMQGNLISDSRNYFGVRYAGLAQRLANRELRAASAPLCSAEAICDRSFRDITPYECVKLVWPEYGIESLVMRVTNVGYGTLQEPGVKLSLMEDVFALPNATFVDPPGSSWVDPAVPPIPVPTARLIPTTAYSLLAEGLPLESWESPTTASTLLVPSPYTGGSVSYTTQIQTADANGALSWTTLDSNLPFASSGKLVNAIPAQASTVIPPLKDVMGDTPGTNFLAMIGSMATPDTELELVLVMAEGSTTGDLTLLRGALDTIPRAWPADTPVWACPVEFFDPLLNEYVEGQTVRTRVITNTSLGATEENASPVFQHIARARASRPARPGNVRLNGIGVGGAPVVATVPLKLDWNHRNRFLEDTQILPWTAASTTIEDGVKYLLVSDAYRLDGSLLQARWYSQDVGRVATATLNTITNPPPANAARITVRAIAVRDGLENWDTYAAPAIVLRAPTGLTASWVILPVPAFNLTWTDNNVTEEGYRVYRSLTPMNPNSLPAPLATLAPGVTTFTDTTASNLVSYFYRVVAFIGSSNAVSAEIETGVAPLLPPANLSAEWVV